MNSTNETAWARAKSIGMVCLGVIAVILGVTADLWYLGMIDQWLIPWSSLRLLAPH